jgi:hypothetical protein
VTRKVLFDDQNLRVLFFEKNSDFLLITFGDSVALVNGDRFYGDSVSEKASISTLGFMPKHRNWYPKESMILAIQVVVNYIDHFDIRILYGGSMGGYAAIKYSGFLQATAVLSHCPQYTINPNEIPSWNPSFSAYYKPSMGLMRITSEDVSGKIYVVYDPNHRGDTEHAEKILKEIKGAYPVHMRYVGHHVTSVMAGKDSLLFQIGAIRNGDLDQLRGFVRNKQRVSKYRVESVLSRLLFKHPFWVFRFLLSYKEFDFEEILVRSFSFMSEKNNIDFSRVRNYLDGFVFRDCLKSNFLYCLFEYKGLNVFGNTVRCWTGSSLVLNIGEMKISSSTTRSVCFKSVPINFIFTGKCECVMSVFGGAIMLKLASSGHVTFVASVSDATLFEIGLLEKSRKFSIKFNNKFLSCQPNNNVHINRDVVGLWENFSLLLGTSKNHLHENSV